MMIKYAIGKIDDLELWEMEFEASIRRPIEVRINNSFIKTYKPIIDDAPYRIFDKIEDYRKWCKKNLPEWLGYGR